jgi:hypothetical protein
MVATVVVFQLPAAGPEQQQMVRMVQERSQIMVEMVGQVFPV